MFLNAALALPQEWLNQSLETFRRVRSGLPLTLSPAPRPLRPDSRQPPSGIVLNLLTRVLLFKISFHF